MEEKGDSQPPSSRHRANITKRWIQKALVILLILAAILTSTWFVSPKGDVIVNTQLPLLILMIGFKFVWTSVVSTLFALTYIKMRKYLGKKSASKAPNEINQECMDHSGIEKEQRKGIVNSKIWRLSLIFFAMYGVFLLALVPWLVVNTIWAVTGKFPAVAYMAISSLFTMAPIINPMLTLTLKKDFQRSSARQRQSSTRSNQSNTVLEERSSFVDTPESIKSNMNEL